MSIICQIAIPLLVTAAVLIAIAIWRKYLKPEMFICVLVALGLGAGVFAMDFAIKPTSHEEEVISGELSSSDAVSLVLAEKYMIKGEYDAAEDILDDLERACATDKDIQLARARLAMLKGDYPAAVPLYKLAGASVEEAVLATKLIASNNYGDGAVIQYLIDKGYNPQDYGLVSNTASTGEDVASINKEIVSFINKKMDAYKSLYGEDIMDAVDKAATIISNFRLLVDKNDYDSTAIKRSVASLDELMNLSADLKGNPHLRQARLKGYVALGDYDKIAATAGADSTAEELVVITEMFVSGLVNKRDFSEEYSYVDEENAQAMVDHCLQVLETNKGKLSDEQYKRFKKRIEQFEERMKDPVLFSLRRDLSVNILNGKETMKSKLYLALAKIEFKDGNTALANEYVDDAIGTSVNSDDDNYRAPMSQLTSIIQGSADPEEIKNVAVYVDRALDNSMCEGVTVEVLVPDNPNEPEKDNPFADHVEDQVGKSTAMLNIGVINKDNFSTVQARVQIQSNKWESLEDIKKNLQVYDCGSKIENFTLEKVNFTGSRIILLCDVSGSMSGNEQALKDAIIAFSQNMTQGEEVGLMTFESYVIDNKPFSSDPNVVASYADVINTGGGTALYSSALVALDEFVQDINSNDIIIAMTDGRDGDSASEKQMYEELGAKAALKGVTIYTMGLGDSVDVGYLEMMAKSCNGSFLYAENTEKMNTFYAFIHGQLANQYILTYEAKNKTRNERKLEISMKDEMGNAEKIYYLEDPEYGDSDRDSYDPYIAVDSELTVSGLSSKRITKSSTDTETKLKGTGFDAGDDICVRLIGNVKYELTVTFKDDQTYSVVIPSNVATGVYDLECTISGEILSLPKELTVVSDGIRKEFQFGSYHFSSIESRQDTNGNTVLSGDVVMNDWLFFKGDITIISDYYDTDRVTIRDESGCYVSYESTATDGLAKFLADNGIPVYMPALGDFTIYDDFYKAEDWNDFPVRESVFGNEINVFFLALENGNYSVYPDFIRWQGINFRYKLPFQEQLMRNFDIGKDKQFVFDSDVRFTHNRICVVGNVEYKDLNDEFTMVSLPLRIKELEVKIDTLRNDYSFSAGVGFKIFDDDGFGFSLGWKDGKFDSLGLKIDNDYSVKICTAPIPVSMKDFGVELSDFSKYQGEKWDLLDRLLQTEFKGKFKINVACLNDYCPKICDLISDDDIALASFDNCEFSIKLKQFHLAFKADFVLATVLDIGKIEAEVGGFDYTNALIGYYNEKEYGIRTKLSLGVKWETSNLDFSLNGSAEATIGYPYSGLWGNCSSDFSIGWGIFKFDRHVSGDAMIGAFKNSYGNIQFTIIMRGTDKDGKQEGFRLDVSTGGVKARSY